MQKIQKDILWLFGVRGALVLSNFMIISITLDILSTKVYGVWIALYTTITWLCFFDLGLGNGMRNYFAVNKAKGDSIKNKQLVSSCYIIVLAISLILMFRKNQAPANNSRAFLMADSLGGLWLSIVAIAVTRSSSDNSLTPVTVRSSRSCL